MKDTVEKQESDTWNRFLSTGRIEDYLQYAVCKNAVDVQNKLTGQVGDSPHAGVYRGNRNHTEADTYR